MKVHLIKQQTIKDYYLKNARSETSFVKWLTVIKNSDWQIPEDILKTFGTADLLGNGSNRVIFNIAGNNNRILCKYYFGKNEVLLFVCWIGTHAEYNKICEKQAQYTISLF